ncbi:MAG: ELM1/GtrOC1 family putative glycosyltransferase [Pseudomonadota bacterium]
MPVIWRLVDGKKGHERQSSGLVQALGKLCECSVHDLNADLSTSLMTMFGLRRRRFPSPRPDLIIGAGRKCQLPLILSKRAFGGQTIYLMRPGLPTRLFDLCVIPRHDAPSPGDNIEQSEGVLNDLSPSKEPDPARGTILIGGPSKHHAWDHEALLSQVRRLVSEDQEITYSVTTSRRTPHQTVEALRGMSNINYVAPENTSDNWLGIALATASRTWVSADSVSMMYEALSAGTRLGIIAVPERRESRITRVSHDLVARGYASTFETWLKSPGLPSVAPLQEAERIAQIVQQRFNLS